MPPRRRVGVPLDQVYKSSTPLQQVKFPERSTSIKSYGKKRTIRVPKQETLTQMDFVLMNQWKDECGEELKIHEDEVEKGRQERSRKRRKTAGDEPPKTPQYNTQTITQLDWSFYSAMDEEAGEPAIDSSETSTGGKKQSAKIMSNEVGTENHPLPKVLLGSMEPPQTPRRALLQEIPSSQSPATPRSLNLRNCLSKRSPLKEQLINVPVLFNLNPKRQPSPSKPPKLVIEDTFEMTEYSEQTRTSSSPLRRLSPAKSVRFAIPRVVEDEKIFSTKIILAQSSTSAKLMQPRSSITKLEIMDSDAESDEEREESSADNDEELKIPSSVQTADEEIGPETCYGEFGRETQLQVEHMLSANSQLSSPPDDKELQGQTQDVYLDNGHSPSTHRIQSTQEQHTIYEKSQAMESQRISTQHVNSLAPRTLNSDIFISIYPQHVTNIVNRTKDHEFRGWLISPTVSRIWIYETKPVGILKYMAVIGSAKRPGEIVDQRGIGNADFNRNIDKSHFAYEILELYELADPLTLNKMVANAWVNGPVQKFAWVRPAVLDQLMANLKPPLFTQHVEEETISPPASSTDSQAAEAQLLSTIHQFTQPASSSRIDLIPFVEAESEPDLAKEVIPSSQQEAGPGKYTAPEAVRLPPSSQATTVDLSQTQTPRKVPAAEVVWESPIRPIYSSQLMRLPTPRTAESLSKEPQLGYSLASSQLLTKSQMFPESLLNESVPGPPPFVEDSDAEE